MAQIKDASDPLTAQLLASHKIGNGYYLPYFDLRNERVDHYRIRILEDAHPDRPDKDQKYAQPKNSGNRVYIPPLFDPAWVADTDIPLLITEGEKKSLAAAQAGHVTLGLGGVYSWRSRIFKLPRGKVRIEDGPSYKQVVLDAAEAKPLTERVAPELLDIAWDGRQVLIVFDSDIATNEKVAQAAFDLAVWLDGKGARADVVRLPLGENGRKVGLDDWLLDDPANADLLADDDWLAEHASRALPPNAAGWVAEQLNAVRVTRPTALKVAQTVVSMLDERGSRYRDAAGNYYYFDNESKVLHEFRMDALPRLRETSFGQLLASEYGLGTADAHIVSRFADDYVQDTALIVPRRVTATKDEALYYQLNDAALARVSDDGIAFVDNGTDGVLMLAGSVAPLDEDEVAKALKGASAKGKDTHWWRALSTLNLTPIFGLTKEQSLALLTCLFYMSPFLNRWRSMNLPLEVAVAEPGSGKTFLYNLRRGILTGRPQLAGLPDDFKGWVASIAATGGMWVCDNLGGVRGDFWHRLSDELARLITDPEPSVDLRQLYTTSALQRVPVHCTFAATTIKNPFSAPDILQRSIIFELNAIPTGERDSAWYERRLANRTEWVAEHLAVLRRFLKSAAANWSDRFASGYRLAGFEQGVLHMGEALELDMSKVVSGLPRAVAGTVAQYDPVMEAIAAFAAEWKKGDATLQQVIDWVQQDPHDRFSALRPLANSIVLGRYINSHKYDLLQSTGVTVTKAYGVTLLRMPS